MVRKERLTTDFGDKKNNKNPLFTLTAKTVKSLRKSPVSETL